jgi:hypothetical protein
LSCAPASLSLRLPLFFGEESRQQVSSRNIHQHYLCAPIPDHTHPPLIAILFYLLASNSTAYRCVVHKLLDFYLQIRSVVLPSNPPSLHLSDTTALPPLAHLRTSITSLSTLILTLPLTLSFHLTFTSRLITQWVFQLLKLLLLKLLPQCPLPRPSSMAHPTVLVL